MANWDEIPREKQTIAFFVNGIKLLWKMLGVHRKTITFLLCVMIFMNTLLLVTPYFWKLIFDALQNMYLTKTEFPKVIIFLIFGILLIGILHAILQSFVFQKYCLKAVITLENDLPIMMHKKLLELSMAFHHRENTGKKISKISKGSDKLIGIICDMFWSLLPNIFFIAINTIVLIFINWHLGLMYSIPMFVSIYIQFYVHKKFGNDWENYEKLREKSTGQMVGSLINIETVQCYSREMHEFEQHRDVRKQMGGLDFKVMMSQESYFFGMNMLLHISFLITSSYAVYLAVIGVVKLGTVVFIINVGGIVMNNVWRIINDYRRIVRNLYAVERIDELLNEKQDIYSQPNSIIPKKFIGEFNFCDVSFCYDDTRKLVLKSFNLTLQPGKMHAFVGKTGNGKSTIIRLILRLYDPKSGDILLDGISLKNLDLEWLRKQFAVVSQKLGIFDGTISVNVKYAYPNATDDEVKEALSCAQFTEVLNDIQKFPLGIETEVGENGIELSGGERQRVGIARAYLAIKYGAKVLILDEATSSLDRLTEKAFQETIQQIRKDLPNITIIAIAHRIVTIKKADYIHVIGDGVVLESGTHKELLAKNSYYSNIVADDGKDMEEKLEELSENYFSISKSQLEIPLN